MIYGIFGLALLVALFAIAAGIFKVAEALDKIAFVARATADRENERWENMSEDERGDELEKESLAKRHPLS